MVEPKNYWKVTLVASLAVSSAIGAIMGHVVGMTYTPYRYIWQNIFAAWLYFSPFILALVFTAYYYRLPRENRAGRARQKKELEEQWRQRNREIAEQKAKRRADEKQQAATQVERERLEKLERLIRVSVKLKRQEIGEYLGLSKQELFDRLVTWAEQFGFKIDGDDVLFEGAQKDDFIAALEKEFSSWNTQKKA